MAETHSEQATQTSTSSSLGSDALQDGLDILDVPAAGGDGSEEAGSGEPSDPEESAEGDEQGDETEQAEEEEQSEESSDELPEKQQKAFPKDVLAKYADRYGLTEEDLGNPKLRQLLTDKINADIYARDLEAQAETHSEEEEEEQQEEPAAAQPADQAAAREQFLTNLEGFVKTNTDPEMIERFGRDVLTSMEVDLKGISKEKILGVGYAFAKHGTNLVNAVLSNPVVFKALVENAFPGFNSREDRSTFQNAWNAVRSEAKGRALPEHGTVQFKAFMKQAVAKTPSLRNAQFNDSKTGRPLGRYENAVERYRLAVQIASSNLSPAEAKQLVQKGRQLQSTADQRARTARLGAGKTQGKIAPKGAERDILDEGFDLYSARDKAF
jgi:hypothetical protein